VAFNGSKRTSPELLAMHFGLIAQRFYVWRDVSRRGLMGRLCKTSTWSSRQAGGKQLNWIFDTITQKNLSSLIEYALWTAEMVAKLITGPLGVRLAANSGMAFCWHSSVTPQRP